VNSAASAAAAVAFTPVGIAPGSRFVRPANHSPRTRSATHDAREKKSGCLLTMETTDVDAALGVAWARRHPISR
jgi:hypothetical protein